MPGKVEAASRRASMGHIATVRNSAKRWEQVGPLPGCSSTSVTRWDDRPTWQWKWAAGLGTAMCAATAGGCPANCCPRTPRGRSSRPPEGPPAAPCRRWGRKLPMWAGMRCPHAGLNGAPRQRYRLHERQDSPTTVALPAFMSNGCTGQLTVQEFKLACRA